ncbi:hypothetical protein [Halopiger thermotolerans]
MERRKILLGSGAALATVLAGCSSSETGDEEPENDTEESFGDDTGNGGDDGSDSGTGNSSDSDSDSDSGSGEHDNVPGVDNGGIEVSDDLVTITSIEKNGDKLDIVAQTDTTDIAELKKVFKTFASDLESAIEDVERFVEAVATIEWILEHEGSRVLAVYVDVEWVVAYLEGELSDEEFADKVVSTKE